MKNEQGARRSLNIAIVGAGSANFGPALLHDAFSNLLADGDALRLVDVNGRSLELMEVAARKMAAHFGVNVTVKSAMERTEVLEGADVVMISAEAERIARWRTDWEIPKRFGIRHTLGENRGPSGLSHTLRTAPLVVSIARDVERLAPHATVIVLTNPEDRLAYAVRKYTGVRVYGYCDGLWDFKDHVARPHLGIPGERLHVFAAGINHAVWITDIRDRMTGEDLYPEMVRRARASGWEPFGEHLYEYYGLWPHENDEHYGEYFHYAHEFMPCKGYDFDAHEAMDADWKRRLERLRAGTYAMSEFVEETRAMTWHVFGDAPPSDVVRGVHLGENVFLQNANLPNDGSIAGLPDDMIVETPGVATPTGFSGVRVPPLPDPILAFLHREGVIQKLSAEAAVEGSRKKAMTALLLDPQVRGASEAETLLDAFLDAHQDILPQEQLRGLRGAETAHDTPRKR